MRRPVSEADLTSNPSRGSYQPLQRSQKDPRPAITNVELVLRGLLERCGSSPEGYRLDSANPIVAALIDRGLLVLCSDGVMLTTRKARDMLNSLSRMVGEARKPAKLKRVRPAKRWKKGLPE
jgi:hypothetical protein